MTAWNYTIRAKEYTQNKHKIFEQSYYVTHIIERVSRCSKQQVLTCYTERYQVPKYLRQVNECR